MNNNNQKILEHAINSFWQAIAANHPNIKTGDFSPLDYITFNSACESAYKTWLASNQPIKSFPKMD